MQNYYISLFRYPSQSQKKENMCACLCLHIAKYASLQQKLTGCQKYSNRLLAWVTDQLLQMPIKI